MANRNKNMKIINSLKNQDEIALDNLEGIFEGRCGFLNNCMLGPSEIHGS